MDFDIQVVHSVAEVSQIAWDRLGNGQPFTSYRWYRFGEAVMADCVPVYIILLWQGEAVARATFWVIKNEPLPIPSRPIRYALHAVLRRWPLFVCRSPLANASGLILPGPPLRRSAIEAIISAATEEAAVFRASFSIFDFMEEGPTRWSDWPRHYTSYTVPDPGTRMEITWSSFDQYLAHLNQKARKHYRQHNREAERTGIKITRYDSVPEVETALSLIQDVERRHRSSPNPWIRSALENASLVNAVWLAAKVNNQLVGCELILEDNGVQMVTALGLAEGVSHVYFLLGYEDVRYAIEKRVHALRWGSGAYDAKERLGFCPEQNNHALVAGTGRVSRLVTRLVTS